uniref:Adenosine deaminase-like n=1 Tax=Cyprinus carpio TaxID=7962 RepID=A0A8C1WYP1_CYPCA
MDAEADLLPKVLHALLDGSVSFDRMETLMKREPHLNIERTAPITGRVCFQVFKVIHQLVDSEEDILMVAKTMIQEFAADGIKYLELRSMPREVTETGTGSVLYVKQLLAAHFSIRQCKQKEVDIDVRFLVAVDRRHGPEVAMDTVKLAEDFLLSSDGIVVGLDLSGDPTVGHGKDLLSALEKAKNCSLKLVLHLSEVSSQRDESVLLLNLPPDRIGHRTFLHPESGGSDSLADKICKQNIPIGKSFPLCLFLVSHQTDDKGVFCTDLSQEYQLPASTFGLTLAANYIVNHLYLVKRKLFCTLNNRKVLPLEDSSSF